jgi:hypothetical protein
VANVRVATKVTAKVVRPEGACAMTTRALQVLKTITLLPLDLYSAEDESFYTLLTI